MRLGRDAGYVLGAALITAGIVLEGAVACAVYGAPTRPRHERGTTGGSANASTGGGGGTLNLGGSCCPQINLGGRGGGVGSSGEGGGAGEPGDADAGGSGEGGAAGNAGDGGGAP